MNSAKAAGPALSSGSHFWVAEALARSFPPSEVDVHFEGAGSKGVFVIDFESSLVDGRRDFRPEVPTWS